MSNLEMTPLVSPTHRSDMEGKQTLRDNSNYFSFQSEPRSLQNKRLPLSLRIALIATGLWRPRRIVRVAENTSNLAESDMNSDEGLTSSSLEESLTSERRETAVLVDCSCSSEDPDNADIDFISEAEVWNPLMTTQRVESELYIEFLISL